MEQKFKPNALAWETGMSGSALFYGLEQSLKLLHETGVQKIASYLERLTDFLRLYRITKKTFVLPYRGASAAREYNRFITRQSASHCAAFFQ